MRPTSSSDFPMLLLISLILVFSPEEHTSQKSRACLDNANTLDCNQCPASSSSPHHNIPRLGMGSSSCAGSENRTFAMSVTPINL